MNSSIDLNLLLLAREGENLTSELPDLYAVTPPRRTARGREADSLIIYLSMTGNSPLSQDAQSKLLEQLAHKFYKTSGSLTAALRTIVEALNLYLLDRNLRSTSMGRQGIGQIMLAALRADALYIAQSGLVHAFVVTPASTQDLYDPQSSGRGLGFSRTAPIRFLQTRLAAGDFLVLATKAAPSWSESSVVHPQNQGLEGLRSQLLTSRSQEFNAVIIQAQEGTGKLRVMRRITEPAAEVQPSEVTPPAILAEAGSPTPPTEASEPQAEDLPQATLPAEAQAPDLASVPLEAQPPDTAPISTIAGEVSETMGEEHGQVAEPIPTPPIPLTPEIATAEEKEISAVSAPQAVSSETPPPADMETAFSAMPAVEPASTIEVEADTAAPVVRPKREPRPAKPLPGAKALARIGAAITPVGTSVARALRSALGTIGAALLRLLKNLLPDADVLRIPPSLMVFMAVAIPLILAVVGVTIFLQRGRAQQYQIYYQQAVEQAAAAKDLTDPQEQRTALQKVLADLNKAEFYTSTSQSHELRTTVTTQLDTMDAVKRLDYKQAIVGGLDSEVIVTRIVATTTDLYLLNGKQGIVLRAILTAQGYVIDPNFQCGPTYGPINVGPLVDIAELPPGSFENASLLGMDANGNLLYCVVDSQPYSASMAPPNTGFGEPSAMSLDRGDLYLLDAKVNAVWIYRNMEVTQQPHLFFGDNIPPMQDVIDLMVYNDDLFLLHADGHTTKCTYSSMAQSPTRCDDPFPYSDNRPGRVHGPVIADAVFNQIYFSSFPERSIYMLSPKNQAIYYFSMQLTLQWQYQSVHALVDGQATAFAVSPNRMAFFAIGQNVYYAAIP